MAAATAAATLAPTPAAAAVKNSCTISGCTAAENAYEGWSELGWPISRGWYSWSSGKCSYAGGEYYNNNGQLPYGDTFWEYDVYPRNCGAHRDAYRIVVDGDTGQAWYSPDHYSDFHEFR
ncbi:MULTISPECIES: ribonuclease domain-containing protein [unclassified Actinoplanes]|uniref:ribonuclease domain-containing protein n=1 Tax=unclassified Actinoplanes TaxID=2626549 RepID=UPI001E2DA93D|nr:MULTISPECIES: ribonuclease domain-containing protein [unclassified Actinoplanes]